ncbi:MAG: hypothetical protein IK083_03200 [Abditibacteriota bacterium]|nr:hypothetical protein [Abditibacteriota bacterium]
MKKTLICALLILVLSAAAWADKIYYHCPLRGAVIVKSFYNSAAFSYRTKCPRCGHMGSSDHKVSGTNGATTGTYVCPRCGSTVSLFIRNETLAPTVPEDCFEVFYHAVLQGGVVTLQQPFAPDFYYRYSCSHCGRLSDDEYYASSPGGLTEYKYDCPRCRRTSGIRILTYSRSLEGRDLSMVYSHCAVTGAIITEYDPFSAEYGYRELCRNCGALKTGTLRHSARSGEYKYSFVCSRCRKKQEVLIVSYTE